MGISRLNNRELAECRVQMVLAKQDLPKLAVTVVITAFMFVASIMMDSEPATPRMYLTVFLGVVGLIGFIASFGCFLYVFIEDYHLPKRKIQRETLMVAELGD